MPETLEQVGYRMGFIEVFDDIADLQSAQPAGASALIDELTAIHLRTMSAVQECPHVQAQLVAGWSNPRPQASVASLQVALQDAGSLAARLAHSAEVAVGQVTSSQLIVQDAVALARRQMPDLTALDVAETMANAALDVAVDFSVLGGTPALDAAAAQARRTEVINVQRQVLLDLQAAVNAELSVFDAAMRTMSEVFGATFAEISSALPTGGSTANCQPSSVTAPTIAEIDASLRAQLEQDKSSNDPATQRFAVAAQAALDQAAATAGTSYLLVYNPRDPDPQGGLAIGMGDVTNADNVLLTTGGVSTGPGSVAGEIETAGDILDAANAKDPGQVSAAIIYAGYNAPFTGLVGGVGAVPGILLNEVPAVSSTEYAAEQGQVMYEQLGPVFDGLDPQADVTAVLHSFGTTVGSQAALAGLGIDRVVFAGSPGVGVSSAEELPIAPEYQFVLANDGDPVVQENTIVGSVLPWLGVGGAMVARTDILGPNPADPEFGAQVIDLNSDLVGVEAHGSDTYFDDAGVDAAAAILTGQFDDVPIVDE